MRSTIGWLVVTTLMGCVVTAAAETPRAPERNPALPTFTKVAQAVGSRLAPGLDGSQRPVRVQTSINMFLEGPVDQSPEADKLRESARSKIYELSGRECELLLKTIATQCRLVAVNVNINSGNIRRQGEDGIRMNATSSYEIVPTGGN